MLRLVFSKKQKKRNSMLHDKQKKFSNFLVSSFILLLITNLSIHADLTTLAKNDPIPMFTTLNIDDALLMTKDQLNWRRNRIWYEDLNWADRKHNRVSISISPFAQNADRGKPIEGRTCPPVRFICDTGVIPDTDQVEEVLDTPLGDLTGRTAMIPLLFGPVPPGREFPSTGDNPPNSWPPTLLAAREALYPGIEQTTPINFEGNVDPLQQFGYFSFPLKYRKRGLRFEAAGLLPYGLGLRLQTGFATIRQVKQAQINLTELSEEEPEFTPNPPLNPNQVNNLLMKQIDKIAQEVNIDFCNDFVDTSMEEVRLNLFWRQGFRVNETADSTWARFLVIPYLQASGSFSPVRDNNYRKFFWAPFGNNGHTSAGLTGGVNFDFLETIEIGGEAGWTHFFKKTFCDYPVPTNEFQNNLYPFSTDVSIQPGDNWYFCARIAAYHFLDRLSMHFEWYVLDHQKDHIHILDPEDEGTTENPIFLPEVLECRSSFKVKLGNIGLNYDLSPNFNIGVLWQIPFSQRNAYRSSTIMAGLNVTF